jgi:hypothetical protein
LENILVQIFDLVKVAIVSVTCIYISRKIYSRQAKKLSIKFKDDLVITTEYFDK